MVTQPQETSSENLSQGIPDLQDEPTIVDDTSPEQIELERQLDIEAGVEVAEQEPVTPEPEPESEPAGVQEEPVAGAQPEPEPQAEPEVQQPRVYTPEEVAKMQSAYDRQIAEQQRITQEAQDQLSARQMEVDIEATIRRQEAQLAQEVGAERASQIARDPQNVALIRTAQESQQKAARLEAQITEQNANAERQAQAMWAQQLQREHELSQEDAVALMEIPTPQGMQAWAERLSTKTATTKAALQKKVPPEKPETLPSNGRSDGAGSETEQQALDRINSLPASDWSAKDMEFMRTGRLR